LLHARFHKARRVGVGHDRPPQFEHRRQGGEIQRATAVRPEIRQRVIRMLCDTCGIPDGRKTGSIICLRKRRIVFLIHNNREKAFKFKRPPFISGAST
jgi:hypothetical protein